MKTREKSFLKLLVTVTMLATLFTSCGKENESGGNGNNSSNTTVAGNGGGDLPSNWLAVLQNEYPCVNAQYNGGSNRNSRVRSEVNLQGAVNVNAGAIHVGVTMEGDIAVLSRSGNSSILEVYACQRPSINLSQQPQISQSPIINSSQSCQVSEISALNVYLNSNYGTYLLAFFPIGLSSPSSLCQNANQYPGVY